MEYDNTLVEALDELNATAYATQSFLEAIELPVYLTFANDSVTIFFEGAHPSCPVQDLQFTDPEQQICTCKIADAFTAFYRLLYEKERPMHLFEPTNKTLHDVYFLRSDLCLLEVAVRSLDDAAKTPATLVEQLSQFLSYHTGPQTGPRIGPIYGIKTTNIHDMNGLLEQYITCDKPNYNGFIAHLQDDVEYKYYCKNLYQICGSILDYLCHYKRYDPFNTKPRTLSLRRCPRCGRYFTTEDRKTVYCQHLDASGKSCAEQQEAERKKKFAMAEKPEDKKIAEGIRHRLYAFSKNVGKASNPIADEKRDKLYKLYMECRKKYSKSPYFSEWIHECEAQIDKVKNGNYDKFYEWLQERSLKWQPLDDI